MDVARLISVVRKTEQGAMGKNGIQKIPYKHAKELL